MTGNSPSSCEQCGNLAQPEDRFCGVCGARVAPATPEDAQVILRRVAANQAPTRSNRKPLLLAGILGVLLLLLMGGGAMALLGSGGEEIELAPGVRSEVPKGWAVADSDGSGATFVPKGYENQNRGDVAESDEASKALSQEASISAFSEDSCEQLDRFDPKEGSTDLGLPQGYDTMTISNGTLDQGRATVAGHASVWDLGYSATAMPWVAVGSSTASDYPNYDVSLTLSVCVEDLGLYTAMDLFGSLSRPPDEAPEDEPTLDWNASVPEARDEVHGELRRRYAANVGAMTDLLEAVDAEGLFNGGRSDLSAIPTSLGGVDAELSDPFGGPLEGFANAPEEEPEDYGTTESTSSASPEPTASASPDSSASPSSEEETLEEFGREYVEASRRGDWEATYSMLDESSQQNFTEAEWAEAQRIMREAEGPPAPLESVSVEQNEEMSDVPATLTLHYEDGTEDTMIAVVPMVVEDESDSGVPKRVLIGQEIGEIRAVASSGQSIEEMMVEAEEAAGDYYRAAGSEDWAYTYENLDSQTQSLFTREEWFQKNQWFADSGEVIYHVESVGMTGTNSEFVGVTLTLTYEDGTSSTRDTYFVYENGSWKHRFGQEENDLFMPDLSYEEFVEAQ